MSESGPEPTIEAVAGTWIAPPAGSLPAGEGGYQCADCGFYFPAP